MIFSLKWVNHHKTTQNYQPPQQTSPISWANSKHFLPLYLKQTNKTLFSKMQSYSHSAMCFYTTAVHCQSLVSYTFLGFLPSWVIENFPDWDRTQLQLVRSLHFKKFIYFIYLFLAALGLRCCAWAFSSCGERGLLFIAVHRLLIVVASHAAEHGL